jgi:hypothetical protein
MKILQNLISEAEILERFPGLTLRGVRDRARARDLGHHIGNQRYLAEDEILKLWEPKCSSYLNGTVPRTGTRGARTSATELNKALELATGGKRKDSSRSSKARSSKNTCEVVPIPEYSLGKGEAESSILSRSTRIHAPHCS